MIIVEYYDVMIFDSTCPHFYSTTKDENFFPTGTYLKVAIIIQMNWMIQDLKKKSELLSKDLKEEK